MVDEHICRVVLRYQCWLVLGCVLETVLFPSISYITVKHGCIFFLPDFGIPLTPVGLGCPALRDFDSMGYPSHSQQTGDSATLVPSTGLEPPLHMLILSLCFHIIEFAILDACTTCITIVQSTKCYKLLLKFCASSCFTIFLSMCLPSFFLNHDLPCCFTAGRGTRWRNLSVEGSTAGEPVAVHSDASWRRPGHVFLCSMGNTNGHVLLVEQEYTTYYIIYNI